MIKFRIKESKKKQWKKMCLERNISLTQLIIDSVEDRPKEDDRRKILKFIKEQDNIFIKIETNINQVARLANAQKSIPDQVLKNFTLQVTEVKKLKEKQNETFRNIHAILSK
ncbi:plasmid mobilization relaxosome protein MobC (plasmid) [Chryseobacterium sp. JJR-5R]|uniref:plasmid mobilization relaxosome protein MobC n=1 Tax=Chryseobacterium sp. JJR-5R TaxID=3093923 RepID=UPI002A75B8D2|nr:plasmid mobilization relaxosome protein MobC [Chryseobacterium sp. JJR-5R]WPO84637.1 plasmid mobilization relaxosome protein MobC [Chryseobacterium sp. JJR-5R]